LHITDIKLGFALYLFPPKCVVSALINWNNVMAGNTTIIPINAGIRKPEMTYDTGPSCQKVI
jgi:hypothetical protein